MQRITTVFRRLFLPAVLLGLLFSSSAARGQYADTFRVTVADKTPEHPYYNVGYEKGYVVNGRQSPTIVLVRDSLYLFDTHEVPINWVLLFYTEPIGGGSNIYRDFVYKEYVSQGLRILKATDETPDTLYYASERQPWMGGMILIVDSLTTSVEDRNASRSSSTLAGVGLSPNPLAEEAELRFVLDDRSHVRVDILNTLGQIVETRDAGILEPGEKRVRLDASALPSGLYSLPCGGVVGAETFGGDRYVADSAVIPSSGGVSRGAGRGGFPSSGGVPRAAGRAGGTQRRQGKQRR